MEENGLSCSLWSSKQLMPSIRDYKTQPEYGGFRLSFTCYTNTQWLIISFYPHSLWSFTFSFKVIFCSPFCSDPLCFLSFSVWKKCILYTNKYGMETDPSNKSKILSTQPSKGSFFSFTLINLDCCVIVLSLCNFGCQRQTFSAFTEGQDIYTKPQKVDMWSLATQQHD